MGRLRIYHKLNTITRLRPAFDGPFLKQTVHKLYNFLRSRTFVIHADSVCWVPAYSDQ